MNITVEVTQEGVVLSSGTNRKVVHSKKQAYLFFSQLTPRFDPSSSCEFKTFFFAVVTAKQQLDTTALPYEVVEDSIIDPLPISLFEAAISLGELLFSLEEED